MPGALIGKKLRGRIAAAEASEARPQAPVALLVLISIGRMCIAIDLGQGGYVKASHV